MIMKDNRKYKRHKIDRAEIDGKIAFADEVIICDLSLGGVSLKADRRMNIGEEYLLKLQNKEGIIRIKGVVVWSLLSGSKNDDKGNVIPIYSAGLRFADESRQEIKELIDFLEEHERKRYKAINEGLNEFVNLSEQFKEVLELFAE